MLIPNRSLTADSGHIHRISWQRSIGRTWPGLRTGCLHILLRRKSLPSPSSTARDLTRIPPWGVSVLNFTLVCTLKPKGTNKFIKKLQPLFIYTKTTQKREFFNIKQYKCRHVRMELMRKVVKLSESETSQTDHFSSYILRMSFESKLQNLCLQNDVFFGYKQTLGIDLCLWSRILCQNDATYFLNRSIGVSTRLMGIALNTWDSTSWHTSSC